MSVLHINTVSFYLRESSIPYLTGTNGSGYAYFSTPQPALTQVSQEDS